MVGVRGWVLLIVESLGIAESLRPVDSRRR